MRRLAPRVAVLAVTAAGALACIASDSQVNALWNDTNGFGIWLYGRPGSCATFDYKHPPYVVFGNGANKREQFIDGTYTVELPNTCLAVTATDVPVCAKGSITATYESATNQYVGSYDFVLRNGEVWKGAFRAERCK